MATSRETWRRRERKERRETGEKELKKGAGWT